MTRSGQPEGAGGLLRPLDPSGARSRGRHPEPLALRRLLTCAVTSAKVFETASENAVAARRTSSWIAGSRTAFSSVSNARLARLPTSRSASSSLPSSSSARAASACIFSLRPSPSRISPTSSQDCRASVIPCLLLCSVQFYPRGGGILRSQPAASLICLTTASKCETLALEVARPTWILGYPCHQARCQRGE